MSCPPPATVVMPLAVFACLAAVLTLPGCRCSEPPADKQASAGAMSKAKAGAGANAPQAALESPSKQPAAKTESAPKPPNTVKKRPTPASVMQAVQLAAPATPVRSFGDAARLLRAVTQHFGRMALGDELVIVRRHGDAARREQVSWVASGTQSLGGTQWTVPALQLSWVKRGATCFVGTRAAPEVAPCKPDVAAQVGVFAGLFATLALAQGQLPDAWVEAVQLDKTDRPTLRMSSKRAGARWWLGLDTGGRKLQRIWATYDGVRAELAVRKSGRWDLKVAGAHAGMIDMQPDAAAGHDATMLLEVALQQNGDGDAFESARRRLMAMRTAKGWLGAGPVGVRVGWLAGKMTLRTAVLPVLGAPLGAAGVIETQAGAARPVAVKGRALDAAMRDAKVPDGCWLALILGGSRSKPGHGEMALLPCAGKAGK